MKRDFKVLISSVGRRAQLVGCFRRAAHQLGIAMSVIGTDAVPELSPASHLVDRCFTVPRCSEPTFVDKMVRLCDQEDINLVVPTIDPELPLYAHATTQFENVGTRVLISGPKTIGIASDKIATHQWFVENGFPTVAQAAIEEVLSEPSRWAFPVIVKPHRGSASVGVRTVQSEEALRALANEPGLIVEELAHGVEHTTNVLVNQAGRCQCAVPHQRLETRAGEVSKGRTTKNRELMDLMKNVAERLPDAYGPLNVQGFIDKNGETKLTEINARFGGGFPLACEAGANFCLWILEELLQLPSTSTFSEWKDNMLMLRFDTAVFVERPSQLP
jgi:carbamoyl-phosphate synthase large subunit